MVLTAFKLSRLRQTVKCGCPQSVRQIGSKRGLERVFHKLYFDFLLSSFSGRLSGSEDIKWKDGKKGGEWMGVGGDRQQ